MKHEDAVQIESSQRQFHQDMRHQTDMEYLTLKAEYQLFEQLKPELFKDGNAWCVLYGKNIQEGICGFGETPYKAIMDFNEAWRKPA